MLVSIFDIILNHMFIPYYHTIVTNTETARSGHILAPKLVLIYQHDAEQQHFNTLASRSQKQRLLSQNHRGHSHSRPYAHRSHADLLVGSLKLVKERGDLAGAGAAKRVTKSDGAALGVDFLRRNAKFVCAPQALAGKSLVDLKNVDVVFGNASELKNLGDGLPRSLAHQEWLDTDNGSGDILAQNLLAKFLSDVTAHEKNGGSAVGDLAGIASVDAAVLGERGAELAEGFGGNTRSNTLILSDGCFLNFARLEVLVLDGKGGNLVVEKAILLSLEGLLVGVRGELVLGSTRDL